MKAFDSMVWYGMVWHGTAFLQSTWYGIVWYGMAQPFYNLHGVV